MFVHQLVKGTATLAALAATAVLAPSTASAQERPVIIYGEPSIVRTELVPLAQLNLATARDQKRLKHKVRKAVDRVCLRETSRPGLQDLDFYACEDDAWEGAAPQIAAAIAKASALAANGAAPIAVTAIRVSAR